MNRSIRIGRWWLGALLAVLVPTAMADMHLSTLATHYGAADDAASGDQAPVIIEQSPHGFDKTVDNLKRAVAGHNFRIIREQPLRQGFESPAASGGRETVLYFCNFAMVDEAIRIDRRVGQFLPCRITVVEQHGQVYLMSINPKRLSTLFADENLTPVCEKITELYATLMSEATF